jgi:lysophospholipase L1-like esterase
VRRRTIAILARLVVVVVGLLFSGLAAEGVFRILEARDDRHTSQSGDGCWVVPDARWGWKLRHGTCRVETPEFSIHSSTNSLSMNDDEYVPEDDLTKTRILALGDSHTQGVGVNTLEAWPKALQRDLEKRFSGDRFRVYNSGTAGYSLHQYLLRLIDQGPIVKPDYVVVGLGLASDLYDLLPPDHGGWAFFETLPRDYFDFDASGALVQKHWSVPDGGGTSAVVAPAAPMSAVKRVRKAIEYFATFRYLRRTNLALAIGAKVHLQGETLWPSMEAVVERDISPSREYNWRLAFALLERIQAETTRLHARLIVLIIPYLPQVYDETWRRTFGDDPRYSRTAAIVRLQEWCAAKGIASVDSTEALREAVAARGHWVHYPKDAHPTAEGNAIIAEHLAASSFLQPHAD